MNLLFGPTPPVLWGSILGTLSDQSDLQTALDGKAAVVHNHDHDTLTNYVPEEHIDWTNAVEDFLTSGSAGIGNILINTNSIATTDTDGNLVIEPNGNGNVDVFAPPSSEEDAININGVLYNHAFRVNDIGGNAPAEFILHKHSTALEAVMLGARANSDTDAHIAVTNSQGLLRFAGAGWSGSHYDIGAQILFKVSDTGTVSPTSLPGAIEFYTTPDGSNISLLAAAIDSAGNLDVIGDLVANNLAGTNTGDQTITLTGDVTGSGTGSFGTTLANSGVSAGSYGSSGLSLSLSVDAKGRITGISTNIINHPVITWASALSTGRTSSGTNPQITAGDRFQLRDAGIYLHSPVDGEGEFVSDTLLTLTSPTIHMANGFQIDLPASGSFSVAFEVDTPSKPGLWFDRPSASTGQVAIANSSTIYHKFGALGALLGDVTHTDGTSSMIYDASANYLTVSNGGGGVKTSSMTTTQRNAGTIEAGRIVFNSTTGNFEGYNGTAWVTL